MLQFFIPFIAVGFGGAFGAMCRFGVTQLCFKVLGGNFPYGTMVVNIGGSFVMGVLIVYFAHHLEQANHAMKLFLVTGFLGAFTTFSAFSLDFVSMFERGELANAVLYAFVSIVLSIFGLFVGLWIMRGVLS